MNNTINIFVYGTLKVGGHFASNFDKFRVSIKKATITGTMVNVHGSFPAVLLNDENTVHGELHTYINPKEVIRQMDKIEGYREKNQQNFYDRIVTTVITEDQKEIKAIGYVAGSILKRYNDLEVIKSGFWVLNKQKQREAA